MRTPKSRLPKDFSLEDRLAGCAQAVERKPETWRGRWHAWEPATAGSHADDGNPAAGAAPMNRRAKNKSVVISGKFQKVIDSIFKYTSVQLSAFMAGSTA